ncbi:MAG: apolipoprotein N-acyltransferase [Bdellovibrionales bacterium]
MTLFPHPFVSSIRDYLRRVSGWKRLFAAFVFGSVLALSMPPFNLFPLAWLCLPALIFLLQGTQNYRQAFVTGWGFAFGFFVFGLYWIASSMFVDIKRFWWAVPFSVVGLPALFAIYYGIAAALARKLGLRGLSGSINFGLMWFLAEVARGYLFTGFPWILLGYAWSGVLPILQVTSAVGIYGLTLLTIVAACLPASLEKGSRQPRLALLASLALFAIIGAWGEIRLTTTALETAPGVRVRLVQPNVDQKKKWLLSERDRHFGELIYLSSLEGEKPVTHIFWPETASTYYLSEDALRRKEIAAAIPAAASVITGVIRRDLDKNGITHFYNSLVALDGLGRLVAGYDKVHLVPFGEFMPWRKYIPLQAIATSGADFTAGPHVRSLRVLGLPVFSPLICYEAIFPGEVVDSADRPDFMVNLTNDGWYGRSTGPYQHFAIARVRAIEEGMSLIRVANTGISGVIDPLGRIEKKLGVNEEGIIDSDLPEAMPLTLYAEWKETFVWIAFFLLLSINAKRLIKLRRNFNL